MYEVSLRKNASQSTIALLLNPYYYMQVKHKESKFLQETTFLVLQNCFKLNTQNKSLCVLYFVYAFKLRIALILNCIGSDNPNHQGTLEKQPETLLVYQTFMKFS